MEKTLSKKTKTACSIIAIAVFLILVYLGDSFIMPTSKWSMLMTVLEKRCDLCAGCCIDEPFERVYGSVLTRTGGFHADRRLRYAIFSIPAADHEAVYQYFEGARCSSRFRRF